jgi:hypothetical protein
MIRIAPTLKYRKTMAGIALDIAAFALIYFTPALSHLLSLPLYLIEPMRLMLILSLVHSNRLNGYLLAISLPMFSLLISGHPAFPKMMLIAAELSLNVFLFYFLLRRNAAPFVAMLAGILISKTVYYLAKFILIYAGLLDSGLFSTPVLIQVITALAFSGYAFLFFRNREAS